MTRQPGTNKVSLTLSNWAGILGTIVMAIASQWYAGEQRAARIEVQIAEMAANGVNRERRITDLEAKMDRQRTEWLDNLKELRRELAHR